MNKHAFEERERKHLADNEALQLPAEQQQPQQIAQVRPPLPQMVPVEQPLVEHGHVPEPVPAGQLRLAQPVIRIHPLPERIAQVHPPLQQIAPIGMAGGCQRPKSESSDESEEEERERREEEEGLRQLQLPQQQQQQQLTHPELQEHVERVPDLRLKKSPFKRLARRKQAQAKKQIKPRTAPDAAKAKLKAAMIEHEKAETRI